MKISRIKEKLDTLLGVSPPSEEESTQKTLKNIDKLIQVLQDKNNKIQEKLKATDDKEEQKKHKRKLTLIKKQLMKADEYKQSLKK